MTIETIIFDLDNTLINRKLAFKAYTERFIERFVNLSDEGKRKEITEYIITADRDGYRKKRELYEEIRTNLMMKDNNTSVEEMLEHWFSEFFKCSILMEGTIEILDNLKAKNIRLGIITNGSVHSQNAKINEVGIRHYFDEIIISDEVEVKKPDPRIFNLALERLNASAKKTLFIGDHPVNDIKGAADAGLHGVWLKGFMAWDMTIGEPRFTINKLNELLVLIESISKKPRNF
jgi:2-haloalkanoic acid dehalogenase type II